jgi:hypothetical protein
MTTDRDALGAHAAVSMLAGLTGAALADRVLALLFAIAGSLAVVFVTDLVAQLGSVSYRSLDL